MGKRERILYWLLVAIGIPVIIYGMVLEPSQEHGIGWLILIEASGVIGLAVGAVMVRILIRKPRKR